MAQKSRASRGWQMYSWGGVLWCDTNTRISAWWCFAWKDAISRSALAMEGTPCIPTVSPALSCESNIETCPVSRMMSKSNGQQSLRFVESPSSQSLVSNASLLHNWCTLRFIFPPRNPGLPKAVEGADYGATNPCTVFPDEIRLPRCGEVLPFQEVFFSPEKPITTRAFSTAPAFGCHNLQRMRRQQLWQLVLLRWITAKLWS